MNYNDETENEEEEYNYFKPDYDEDDKTTFQLDEDGNMYDLYGNYINEYGD